MKSILAYFDRWFFCASCCSWYSQYSSQSPLARIERNRSTASAPRKLQRAPVISILSFTTYLQSPSVTHVAIGSPSLTRLSPVRAQPCRLLRSAGKPHAAFDVQVDGNRTQSYHAIDRPYLRGGSRRKLSLPYSISTLECETSSAVFFEEYSRALPS